jgi:hypothetical protein
MDIDTIDQAPFCISSMTSPMERNYDNEQRPSEDRRQLAKAVRSACIEAARRGYEEAKMSGLCHEGAWENAISAIQMVDVDQIATRLK